MKVLDYFNMKQKLQQYFLDMFGENVKNKEITRFECETDNSSHFMTKRTYKLEFYGCKYYWKLQTYDRLSYCDVYEGDKIIVNFYGIETKLEEISGNKIGNMFDLYAVWEDMIKNGDDVREYYNKISRRDKLMEIDENLRK